LNGAAEVKGKSLHVTEFIMVAQTSIDSMLHQVLDEEQQK